MDTLGKIEILHSKFEQPSFPYDFYVDRRTAVGNPFELVTEKERDLVCDAYEKYFYTQRKLRHDTAFNVNIEKMYAAFKKHGQLRLFCWCAPRRCHAETIKDYMENRHGLEQLSKESV